MQDALRFVLLRLKKADPVIKGCASLMDISVTANGV